MRRSPAGIPHDLPFRNEPYILSIYVPNLRRQEQGSGVTANGGSSSLRKDGRECSRLSSTWLGIAAQKMWPQRSFQNHARYEDELHKFQRWFGVDIFMTVRFDQHAA